MGTATETVLGPFVHSTPTWPPGCEGYVQLWPALITVVAVKGPTRGLPRDCQAENMPNYFLLYSWSLPPFPPTPRQNSDVGETREGRDEAPNPPKPGWAQVGMPPLLLIITTVSEPGSPH